jgi:hypothetical protein
MKRNIPSIINLYRQDADPDNTRPTVYHVGIKDQWNTYFYITTIEDEQLAIDFVERLHAATGLKTHYHFEPNPTIVR